ncbi:MAG: hypothetical protein COA67_06565 [Lutibacter sp.]|nr:MAG: hypothetical protein COA67_06565 [Lutibacter sp.]
MKKIILSVVLLFVATITQAQNSLFNNISTTDQYDEYWSIQDPDGDGNYLIKEKRFIVKFETKFLPTGEGYALSVTVDEGSSKGHGMFNPDAVERDYLCSGYPYESFLKDKRERSAFVAIGDYIFIIRNISKDGTSFDGIDNVFIKRSASTTKTTGGKKKKMSFREKLKALKNASSGKSNYGEAHKQLQSKNLDKFITDYLVTMKAKQDGRIAAEKQQDKNIENAKALYDSDLNAYNDKIRASPEYQKMKAHQARMKEMENGESKKMVTIYNKTGKDIYIYQDGARNGTRINANSSTKVDCSSNYTYKFDSNSNGSGSRCYSANSGCERSVTVK